MPDFKQEKHNGGWNCAAQSAQQSSSPFLALFQQSMVEANNARINDAFPVGSNIAVEILNKLDNLERKIDLIFGRHVFIRGRAVDMDRFCAEVCKCKTSK